jgi:hypothetical protein
MNDTDWKAAMSSEIFREYAANETLRAHAEKEAAEQSEIEAIEAFATFEREVRQSPDKLQAFRVLKEKFRVDAEYKSKTHPLFVEAVMLLNLDE